MTESNERFNTKTSDYKAAEEAIISHLLHSDIPENEMLENLHLFITPQQMRRILFFYEIYKQIIDVPGVIMQFGVRWGRELALFESLRTTFEPFNHSRKIIGFDTFAGYDGVDPKDGSHSVMKNGNLAITDGYFDTLDTLLRTREALSPIPQQKKFELVKGNAEQTLENYLAKNPQTVVSLAHLDMNIYAPTKHCLELLREYMPKGSIVIIDEVNLGIMPGETIALREVFGLHNIRLKREPAVNPTWPAYFVVD